MGSCTARLEENVLFSRSESYSEGTLTVAVTSRIPASDGSNSSSMEARPGASRGRAGEDCSTGRQGDVNLWCFADDGDDDLGRLTGTDRWQGADPDRVNVARERVGAAIVCTGISRSASCRTASPQLGSVACPSLMTVTAPRAPSGMRVAAFASAVESEESPRLMDSAALIVGAFCLLPLRAMSWTCDPLGSLARRDSTTGAASSCMLSDRSQTMTW